MRSDNIKLAILYSLLAALFYATIGTLIKLAEKTVANEMVVFFRQCFSLIALTPFLLVEKTPISIKKNKSFHLHLLRAFSSLAAMYCLVYALKYLPLVDALLLTYTRPLFIPIVVFLWFKKKWSKTTSVGLVVGFLGVALILKPDKQLFDIAALVGLASGLFGAIAFTCIRRLTKTNAANTILFYYFSLSIPIAAIPVITAWKPPSLVDWGFLVAIGIVGMIYQMTLTRAYQHAKAFKVASMLYSTVIFGACFDFWLGDFKIDYIGLIGIILVIVGTIITIKQKVTPFPPETPGKPK